MDHGPRSSEVFVLIKAFCETTGLPRDTVRFYVKRGLLRPVSTPGNRYQDFDREQVERARLIKAAQSLGFTLREIAALGRAYEASGLTRDEKAGVLRARLAALDEQARTLRTVRVYLAAKLQWLEGGERGAPPAFVERHGQRPRGSPERDSARVSEQRPLPRQRRREARP